MSRIVRIASLTRGRFWLHLSCGHIVIVEGKLAPRRKIEPCKECLRVRKQDNLQGG